MKAGTRPEIRAAFPKGTRVRLSAEGRASTLQRQRRGVVCGTVVGHSTQMSQGLTILIDGNKHPQVYHAAYWEHLVEETHA